jgi:DNA-binding PadR family transcriptional regulator
MKGEWDQGDWGPRAFWMRGPGERGRGRHGFGGPPWGGPMGMGGPFGGGRGRKRRGDVRTALLMLLDEEPRNGYQLMQTIEERSGGHWRVSPGSVYPSLAQLEDEGLVRSVERDGSKLFEITDQGRAQLSERGDQAPPWEHAADPDDETGLDLRSLIGQIAVAATQVVQAGDEQQIATARETLKECKRALYRILAEDAGD